MNRKWRCRAKAKRLTCRSCAVAPSIKSSRRSRSPSFLRGADDQSHNLRTQLRRHAKLVVRTEREHHADVQKGAKGMKGLCLAIAILISYAAPALADPVKASDPATVATALQNAGFRAK